MSERQADTTIAANVDGIAAIMARRKLTKASVPMVIGPGGETVHCLELEMSPLGFDMPATTPEEREALKKDEMPSDADMLLYSAGGPLPSELDEALKVAAGKDAT